MRPRLSVVLAGLTLGAALALAATESPQEAYEREILESMKALPGFAEAPTKRAIIARRLFPDRPDEHYASIAVWRDLARRYEANQRWVDAILQLRRAKSLAEALSDSTLLMEIRLEVAENLQGHRAANAAEGIAELEAVAELNAPLRRPEIELRVALLRAQFYSELNQQSARDEAYAKIWERTDLDRLTLERHRAMRTSVSEQPLFFYRWKQVLALAREQGKRAVEAQALDQLGRDASFNFRFAEDVRYFDEAESVGVPVERTADRWLQIVRALSEVDDRPRAHKAIEKAQALVNEASDPARSSTLREARASLLSREGNFEVAYRELERANELRRKAGSARQAFAMPLARMVPSTTPAENRAIAELTAVKSALQLAELDRTKLKQRQTAWLAAVALLVAAVVTLAFLYKRRDAIAAAHARDAETLRAERTRWQLLRAQLSPHFLFNALSSLGGLVVTDPPAAGRVIDRLSEFCQLALETSNDDLRSLEQELRLIRAYLDVEQAGAGDTLKVTYEIDPAVKDWKIPPLLLQPLVENALKYGGQTSGDLLEVRISADPQLGTDELKIEIANTGAWVEAGPEQRARDPIGVANVRERLQRVGGGDDALTVDAKDGWVRVVARLPRLVGLSPAVA